MTPAASQQPPEPAVEPGIVVGHRRYVRVPHPQLRRNMTLRYGDHGDVPEAVAGPESDLLDALIESRAAAEATAAPAGRCPTCDRPMPAVGTLPDDYDDD